METVLIVLFVIVSLFLIVSILLQSGKGSGLAAGFGGASAGTQMFGGSGAGGFLVKVTVVLGGLFMIISLSLAYLSSQPKSAMSLEGSGTTQRSQEDEIVEEGGAAGSGSVDLKEDKGSDEAKPGAGAIDLKPVDKPTGDEAAGDEAAGDEAAGAQPAAGEDKPADQNGADQNGADPAE